MKEKDISLSEKFIKKGFWLYFFGYIIAPTGYIIKILISGEISVNELGILYGVISLVTLIGAFSDLGISESIKYFIPKYLEEKKYEEIKSILVYGFLIHLVTGVLITSTMYWGSEVLALNYFNDINAQGVLQNFAFFFLGINLFQLISHFFLATQNTYLYKFSEFLRMIFLLISVSIMIFGDISDINILSFSWIFGLYVGVLFSLISFHHYYYKKYFQGIKTIWSWNLFKKLLSYALLVFLSAQASIILSQLDMQMIIYLLGTHDAGYYTTYLSFIMIPFLLIGPIFPLLLPMFSQLSKQGKHSTIIRIKSLFQKYLGLAALIFSFFFFMHSDLIALTLFGSNFLPSGEILLYSCMFLIFNFLMQINFNILGGIGKVSVKLKIISFAIVLNFILNLLLINIFGVAGAALATGFGWFIIWILSELYLRKEYFTKLDYIFYIKNIFLLIILSGLAHFIYGKIELHNVGRMYLFFYLLTIGLTWVVLIGFLNKKDIIIFLGEIKKIKTSK